MSLEQQPLHVVIRIPYKRPHGFVEPPSVVWTEEMEQKLWEILTQNKRQSIDWYAASRLLNVPVPYLLRHASFLYETQLRGVQKQLRRGETLSASNSGIIGSRNRASSRASLTKVSIFEGDGTIIGHQRPPSAMSNASREQHITSRGGHVGSQDMTRTGSNTSLTDGRKQTSGSASSSLDASVVQSTNETSQVKNVLVHTQTTPSPLPIGMTNISGRPTSPSSSVSTITTDQIIKQSTHIAQKQDNYTTILPALESSTNTSFATPSASVAMPLSRTLSNPLSLDTHDLSSNMMTPNIDPDNDYDEYFEENDSLKKSDEFSLSDRLAKLQMQDLAAFLPISQKTGPIDTNNSLENNDLTGTPIINLTPNSQQPSNTATKGSAASGDSQQSLSANDSANSSSSLDSLTQSELESAYLEASNFNNSKMSVCSPRKSFNYPGA
ncbi:18883_t:CDS:2 [Funneliformis geosporum]|uniref:Autophagy-related protein 29 n=1 Tax=Funneliformis geosporum TaxID=1117311 RepID=A0A9W4SR35_9GLOM|nr:18883_t:CDS:2 [Funneliformis geosporum]CAI2178517.1 17884_t:CDS:2 [Funneliformis geosporum]